MKNYFFNILLTAVVAIAAAVLTFLVGNESGSFIGAAIIGGVFTGVSTGVSYCLGCMTNEDEGKFNGTRLAVMLVSGTLAGILGGLMMGWN